MGKKLRRAGMVVAAILVVGANLRLPITMMPPLLPMLKASIGLSPALAGMLTTIPLIMFALVSPILGQLGSRHGNERILLGALAILSVGSYLRIVPNVAALIVGTCCVGIGIAGGNVLLPAIIKEQFPTSIAAKTTMYTSMQALVASCGTAGAGVIAIHTNLMTSMAVLSLVGIAALLMWVIALPHMRQPEDAVSLAETVQKPQQSVWRSPLAWVILLFFGLQSTLYYTLVTWLPSLWEAAGFSTVAASTLTTIFVLGGLPASLVVPSIAEKAHGMAVLNALVFGGFFAGAAGLLLTSTNFGLNVVFAVLMGVASGASFSLCIVFFQKRTERASDTARLSGMAQAGGYVLAALGPVGIGFVKDVTHSWTALIYLTLLLTVAIGVAGTIIIRKRSIFKDEM